LGYASYVYDRETKLYYLQARYYDPETARFISRDPDPGDSDDPKTQNGYAYADNNPVMLVDPDGHAAFLAALACIPGWGWVVLGGLTIVYGLLNVAQKGGFVSARSKADTADPAAKGRPHTRYKTGNGKVKEYTTYGNGEAFRKQFRGEGKSHGDETRPNIKSRNYYNRNPKSKKYPKERVRKPYKKEYPKGYK
jgi:RHS repeat-associated protein